MSVKWNSDLMGPFVWTCGKCEKETSVTHFRQGADGVMFHAGPNAPPSDETNQSENFVTSPRDTECDHCEGRGWTEEPSAIGIGSFQQQCDYCQGLGITTEDT